MIDANHGKSLKKYGRFGRWPGINEGNYPAGTRQRPEFMADVAGLARIGRHQDHSIPRQWPSKCGFCWPRGLRW